MRIFHHPIYCQKFLFEINYLIIFRKPVNLQIVREGSTIACYVAATKETICTSIIQVYSLRFWREKFSLFSSLFRESLSSLKVYEVMVRFKS